ncbi:hypothetical protein BpJC4_22130 [Weizmannia acidilactici]|nr:transposase [Weizmannia acidilactici]GER67742.1 hypothetical protein BpJC4_22130 [Weizmannia acidilactici]
MSIITILRQAIRSKRKIYKKLKEDYLPRLKKYEAQLEIFGDRNSYSKTDHDATFMRMKEDHMKNGQLKPGYNVQIGTEDQLILGYTIHQRPTDTRCFVPHLEKLKASGLPKPKRIIADAGYGGEANYLYAHEEEFEALIPYNTMRKEETRAYKKDIRNVSNWEYREKDEQIYARRKIEVESVFGHIKGNRSFRRFSLRGLEKVNIEFGLGAIVHNLLKQAEKNRLFQKEEKPSRKLFSQRFFLFKKGLLGQPLLSVV